MWFLQIAQLSTTISERKGKILYNGKCSKISNTFLFRLLYKMLVIRAEIHKMYVRIANREEPDLTASSEAVRSSSTLLV